MPVTPSLNHGTFPSSVFSISNHITRLFLAGMKISTAAFFFSMRTLDVSGLNVGILRRGGDGVVEFWLLGLSASAASIEEMTGGSSALRLRPANEDEHDVARILLFSADADVALEPAMAVLLETEDLFADNMRVADCDADEEADEVEGRFLFVMCADVAIEAAMAVLFETEDLCAEGVEVLDGIADEVIAAALVALPGLVKARSLHSFSSVVIILGVVCCACLFSALRLGGMNIAGLGIDESRGFGAAGFLNSSTRCCGATSTLVARLFS